MQVNSALHIMGKPHIEHSGIMKITNLQSDLVAKIKFEASSRLSIWSESHQVRVSCNPQLFRGLYGHLKLFWSWKQSSHAFGIDAMRCLLRYVWIISRLTALVINDCCVCVTAVMLMCKAVA